MYVLYFYIVIAQAVLELNYQLDPANLRANLCKTPQQQPPPDVPKDIKKYKVIMFWFKIFMDPMRIQLKFLCVLVAIVFQSFIECKCTVY